MFKRDMIICIRESDTGDSPVVLPIVDETISITTNDISTPITDINMSTPRFTELYVNRGIRETKIQFTTYIKPQVSGGVNLPDRLLYASLTGDTNISETTAANITVETINNVDMQNFDVFLFYKGGGNSFVLKNAVTASATFMFDISGIARIKWVVSGIIYEPVTIPSYVYPQNLDIYITNKWTQAHMYFPPLSQSYGLAATKFSFTIRNSITFPFVEKLSTKFNKPEITPVLDKREISIKFSAYLKIITFYNDLISIIEQYTYLDSPMNFNALIGVCGNEAIDLTVDNVTMKYPKIGINDVTTLDLNMKAEKATLVFNQT